MASGTAASGPTRRASSRARSRCIVCGPDRAASSSSPTIQMHGFAILRRGARSAPSPPPEARPFSPTVKGSTMHQAVVPMIRVPDVRATAAWYISIGFTLERVNEEDGELNWALLTFNGSQIMLNTSGKPSNAHRREVDLYIHNADVDLLRRQLGESLGSSLNLVQDLYNTFTVCASSPSATAMASGLPSVSHSPALASLLGRSAYTARLRQSSIYRRD